MQVVGSASAAACRVAEDAGAGAPQEALAPVCPIEALNQVGENTHVVAGDYAKMRGVYAEEWARTSAVSDFPILAIQDLHASVGLALYDSHLNIAAMAVFPKNVDLSSVQALIDKMLVGGETRLECHLRCGARFFKLDRVALDVRSILDSYDMLTVKSCVLDGSLGAGFGIDARNGQVSIDFDWAVGGLNSGQDWKYAHENRWCAMHRDAGRGLYKSNEGTALKLSYDGESKAAPRFYRLEYYHKGDVPPGALLDIDTSKPCSADPDDWFHLVLARAGSRCPKAYCASAAAAERSISTRNVKRDFP